MRRHQTVILFDVDNTLLNNDRVVQDLRRHLRRELGPESERRYFQIFEHLRSTLGYTDYLGTLQRYRQEHPNDPAILHLSLFLIDYPFAKRLYPRARQVISAARRYGIPVILSDGDAVFQPHKVETSGLWKTVRGRVMIFIHKERMLKTIERLYPADHYVMVDDKLRILTAMKRIWKRRVTTVFVRQGHYAHDPRVLATYPAADITVNRIGDLLTRQAALDVVDQPRE